MITYGDMMVLASIKVIRWLKAMIGQPLKLQLIQCV